MSKRFEDMEKYKKEFIKTLPAPYKIFWDYLNLDCNAAGIWHVDFEVAQIRVGKDAPINGQEALKFFNNGEIRIKVFDNNLKWFIVPFIGFQYGELQANCKPHASVIATLSKYGLLNEFKGYAKGIDTLKDKEQEQYKEQRGGVGGEKEKHKQLDFVYLSAEEDRLLVERFGERNCQDMIARLNDYIGSKGTKYKSHYHTILNWIRRDGNIKQLPKVVELPDRNKSNAPRVCAPPPQEFKDLVKKVATVKAMPERVK